MKRLKYLLIFLLGFIALGFQSCNEDDEPISIEGRWIVTKWSNGSNLEVPDRVISWTFNSNGKAYCSGESMNYTLDGNKLKIGSTTYTIKFINDYTMEWSGGYGHYKRVQLTRD